MRKIIVARYKEDVSWTETLPKEWEINIVQKETDLPNLGREPSSFLWWIINNYDTIKIDYSIVFVQGNPFDHCPDLYQKIGEFIPENGYVQLGKNEHESDGNGNPHDSGLPVAILYEQWFRRPFPGRVYFVAGGQFIVSGERIKSWTKDHYINLYNDSLVGRHCYVFERMWKTLFTIY